MSNLRHRIELAIMGRTAPRAADAVMAVLAEQADTTAGEAECGSTEWERERAELVRLAQRHDLDNHHNAALCPYCTPRAARSGGAQDDEPEPTDRMAAWQAEANDPEAGHTFRIEAHSRGSYAVDGVEGHTDADWFQESPFVIEVRAWSLSQALAKAARLPLPLWSLDGRRGDQEPEEVTPR